MEHFENTTTNKTADKRTYMREYKQKKYNENARDILDKNKAYYYKNKLGLDQELLHKYNTLLPYVAKIRLSIDEFKEKNLGLSIEYLTELLIELQDEDLRRRRQAVLPISVENIVMSIQEV